MTACPSLSPSVTAASDAGPASIRLRDYQERAIRDIREAFRRKRRRLLVCLPTGAGKTALTSHVLISALAKLSRSMFVAHRIELIDQSVRTFYRFGVKSLGVVRAQDIRRDLSQPIQVCSIQTLRRRPALEDIKIVAIDEAHLSSAKSYEEHLFKKYPNALFLGLTATPIGPNGRPLPHWDEIVIGARYSELIEQQHIVEPMVYSTPLLPDLASVHTVAGDFNKEELEAAVSKGTLIGNLVDQWVKHAGNRRTAVFAVSVAHSQMIVAAFVQAGVSAEHVDGTTEATVRAAVFDRLRTGETRVVSNVGICTEGWDAPWCKCVVLARPTKSLSLYIQMGGRPLRPWNENVPAGRSWEPADGPSVQPVILDHGGNWDRFEALTGLGAPHADREWSLDKVVDKVQGAALTKMCPECFAYIARCLMICPHCQYEYTKEQLDLDLKRDEPIPVDLELRALTVGSPEMAERLAFFRATAATGRAKGWKYAAIFHRYRERFGGEEPLPAWVAAVKADYKNDAEWKERVKEKEPLRKEWRLRREQEALANGIAPVFASEGHEGLDEGGCLDG